MAVTMCRYIAFEYKFSELSLFALSKFKNLTELSLGSLPYFLDIGSLTTLKTLYLGPNHYVNDTTLCKLTNITTLSLAHNQYITDKSLQCLTKIVDLDIYANDQITSAMLKTLTNLTKLGIGRNNTNMNDSLERLTKLSRLILKGYKFVADKTIMNLANITYLRIEGDNDITDNSLRNLTNLKSIRLQNFNHTKYESLKFLTNLTELDLRCDVITDHELGKIGSLRLLTITNQTCSSTSKAIGKLTNLEKLQIQHSGCVRNRDLFELTNLNELLLSGCSGRRRNQLWRVLPNTIITDDCVQYN